MMMLFFVYPLLLINAQPYSNVSLSSSIIANNDNSKWVSPSGDFAFGFRKIAPAADDYVGGYLLGIWFDKIPEKTIVWSANRDNPVEEGSKIKLFADGRFELDDPRGHRIWGADFVGSGVAYGAILDNGDFVLATNTSSVVWRSFDHPTDTMLPTQVLNPSTSLISSFSQTNYSRGRFQLTLETNGNLTFYTRNFPIDGIISAYWSSRTPGIDSQLIFNQSGYIILAKKNGTILNYLSSNGASIDGYHQRATMDYDGVFRHYVYPKFGNSTGGRLMEWSVLEHQPADICTSVFQTSGPGACGFNSLCSLANDQMPTCSCPTGYSQINRYDRMSGCKPDFVPHSCDQGSSQESSLFTLVDMPNTNWPDAYYGSFGGVTEDWCRQSCLDDCFCAVAFFRGNNCWKKRYPLSNGRIDTATGGKALIKVRKSNGTTSPYDSNRKTCHRSTIIAMGSVLLGGSVFLNLILLAATLLFVFSHLKRRKSKKLLSLSSDISEVNFRSFSFNELKEATNGFEEVLGNGACSTVYKGTLKNENGKMVAVKKLDKIATEAEREFKAEVSSISRTNHKNLVQLLGYCDEDQNRLLVYEFMSNGSVASFLFQNSRPNWYRRVQIAFATARGLCYLHEECNNQIIHCDIKPQNILLNESLVPKISDFGLAKLLKADQTRTMTVIRGTRGYVAPEWFKKMPVTAKVDVYSFGIVLLELVCCRRHVLESDVDENEAVLAFWAHDCYRAGKLKVLVSKDEEAIADMKRVEKLVMIAMWCIQEDPSLRPNMKRVMLMLEGTIEVPVPPDLESFID